MAVRKVYKTSASNIGARRENELTEEERRKIELDREAAQPSLGRLTGTDIPWLEDRVRALAIEAADLRTLSRREAFNSGRMEEWRKNRSRINDIENALAKRTVQLNSARRTQNALSLASAPQNEDFLSFNGYRKQNDSLYEYINGKDNGQRKAIDLANQKAQESRYLLGAMQGMDNPGLVSIESPYQEAGYDLMNDDEIGIYNYYYAKDGQEKANQYLKSIEPSLQARKATGAFQQMENNTALEMLFGVSAGLDQWESGAKALMDGKSDYIAPTATQLASQMVRQDLADTGAKLPDWLGGGSIGQGIYDAVTTTANMAPSILSSMVSNLIVPGSGPIVGNAMMFASAAGNAYTEALNAGYDKRQARLYSTLVGGSEIGLQLLLGGISSLGGGSEVIKRAVDGIDNAVFRIAGKLGQSFAAEGLEEGIQEVLTPVFKQAALKAGNGLSDVELSEVAYSALLGGLTGLVFEGFSTSIEAANAIDVGKQVKDAGIDVKRLQELGSTMSADSVAYKLAGKIDESTGAYTIGRMFNELGASLTEQNRADIQHSLEAKGMDSDLASKTASAFSRAVSGEQLNGNQQAILEANDILTQAVIDGIIEPNSTVYQRTQGYNEMLRAMADKQAGVTQQQTSAQPQQSAAPDANIRAAAEQAAAQQLGQEPQAAQQSNATRIATQEPVMVTGIASVDGGNVRLTLADGQEAAIGELDLGDAAPVYEAAASVADTPEVATRLVKGFDGSPVSGAEYGMALRHAYRLGQILAKDQALRSGFIDALPREIQSYVVDLGQNARSQTLARETQTAETKSRPAVKLNEQGGYLMDPENLYSKDGTTDAQRENIDAITYLADTLQIPIYLYESEVQNGRRIGANGWYDPTDGSIHIDIHAGMDGEGTMLFTLAHELTHQMRDWDPQKFRQLADFLIAEYGKKGIKVDELIENKLPQVRRTYMDKGFSEDQLYDIAYEEVVADSMEPMLTDGRVIQKLKARDNTAWAFMRDFIRDIAEKIHKAYAKLKPNSVEGKHVAAMKDSIEAIEDLFLEGIVSASGKASRAQKNTAQQGGVAASSRYSMREINIKRKYIDFNDKNAEAKAIDATVSDLVSRNKVVSIPIDTFVNQKTNDIWANTKEARKYLKKMLSLFLGNSVYFSHQGQFVEAYLTKRGLNHSSAITSAENYVALERFNELVTNAEYSFSSLNDEHSNENTSLSGAKDWDCFVAAVKIGKDVAPVVFKIRTIDRDLRSQIHYMATKKEIDLPHDHGQQTLDNLPNYGYPSTSGKNVTQNTAESQGKKQLFSMRDNYGRALTKEQIAFFRESKAIDKDGHLLTLYHQTENQFTVFDTRRKGSGARDVGTPFGVFLKSKQDDIGLKGKIQMELYANIKNPLFAYNREDLLKKLNNLSPEYSHILAAHTALNSQYHEKFENAKEAFVQYMSSWYKDHPGATRNEFRNDSNFEEMYNAERLVVAEWESLADELSLQAKEVLTQAIGDHGYDGIILYEDAGSHGRSTDAYIALYPEQVKSVTNKTPTSIPDIRYQERSEQMRSLNESLRQEQEALQEDFDETKAVFQILGISENEGIFTRGSVTAVAQRLIKLAGAKRKTGELTDLLTEVFTDLAGRKNLTWSQAETALTQTVDWLMENRRPELDSFSQDVLDDVRGKEVYLDDQQKQEAGYLSGSYNGYRRSLFGTLNVTDKAKLSLDSQWKEWARDYPSIFDPNTNSSDMPRALQDAVRKLRDMATDRTMGFDVAGLRQELLREAYDGLIRAAVYPAEADQLMTWRDAKLQGLTEAHEKQIRQILKKHETQMDKLRQRQQAEINTIKENYRKQQEWRKYSREKTEIRHRIQRTVNQLNSMLLHETKNRHIPEVLKMAVVEALETVNMDTVNAQARIKELQKQLETTSDRDKVEDLRERIATLQEMGGRVDKKLERLEKAYSEVKADSDPALDYAFDEEVLNQIQRVKGLVGRKALREMTKSELEAVDELYTVIMTRVRTMNETFASDKKESISKLGKQAITEVGLAGGRTDKRLAITQPLRAFFWNNEKPIYAFERIGSNTLTGLYKNVRKGEDVWAQDVAEARAFVREQIKAHNQKNWDMEKKYIFTGTNGREFSLDIGQIMTLYAYSKRKQSWDHLEKGGFQIEPGTKVVDQSKKIFKDFEWTTAQTYKVNRPLLEEIISILTPEQRAFADAMQKYLSDDMGAKGNEVSMKLYGIKLFKEKYYFPLKSSPAFLDQEAQKAKGEVKIKSKGFTKQTQDKASNPVYLRSFMDVWADHVNEMSMYHGFTLPLEDLYRVRNYREGMVSAEGDMDAADSRSVTETIQNAYGKEAVQYIEQLLKDLNGGTVGDPRETIAKGMMSKHKKAAVMASLSVLVQQPTSLYRAMAEVDYKYFTAAPITRGLFRTANPKKHQQLWNELKTYAPVAIIKEMGYFDTNMGMSTRDYLQAQEYDGLKEKVKGFWTDEGYRDEIFGKLPAVADELAWVSIWEAVKKEQADKNKALMNSDKEAFLRLCGERFTDVIAKTQVYDSVLSRSANMRAKGAWMSMATSFMAEPTTTANMIEEAVRRGLKGDKKYARRVFGAVLGSHLMNSLLVSFVYAMRDDDEDETFTEKYFARLSTELLEGINPITYIPFAKDVWSVMQGFDVERADMSLVSDLITAAQNRITLAGKDTESMSDEQLQEHLKKINEANWALADIFGSVTGFPVKNIRRDAMGVKNLLKTLTLDMNGRQTTTGSLLDKVGNEFWRSIPGGEKLMGESKSKQLYDAIVSGDAAYVSRLKTGYKTQDSYNQAVRKALRENDSRIAWAAEARNTGDISTYTKLAKEIIGEGRFSQDDVVSAINAEINALNKGESTLAVPKAKSLYKIEDFQSAIIQGNSTLAKSIRDEILRIEQVNGKTKEEAEKSFQSSVTSSVKDAFLEGSLTARNAEAALLSYTGIDAQDAVSKVAEWSFEKDYGFTFSDRKEAYLAGKVSRQDMIEALTATGKTEEQAEDQLMVYDWLKEDPGSEGITAPAIEDYNAFCAGVGISKRQYFEAWKDMSELEADYDESGKTVQNSRTQKVMAYINSLPLYPQQKQALALTQYKSSKVQKYRLW